MTSAFSSHESQASRALILSAAGALLATVLWAGSMEVLTHLGGRMVAIELAEDGPHLAAAMCGREPAITLNTHMDFVFICLYACTFALLSAVVSTALNRRSLLYVSLLLVVLAAALDVIENFGILTAVRLGGCDATNLTARAIRLPSTYKWIILFGILVLLGVAYLRAWHGWLRVAGVVFAVSGLVGTVALRLQPLSVGKVLTGAMAIGAPLMIIGLFRLLHVGRDMRQRAAE